MFRSWAAQSTSLLVAFTCCWWQQRLQQGVHCFWWMSATGRSIETGLGAPPELWRVTLSGGDGEGGRAKCWPATSMSQSVTLAGCRIGCWSRCIDPHVFNCFVLAGFGIFERAWRQSIQAGPRLLTSLVTRLWHQSDQSAIILAISKRQRPFRPLFFTSRLNAFLRETRRDPRMRGASINTPITTRLHTHPHPHHHDWAV